MTPNFDIEMPTVRRMAYLDEETTTIERLCTVARIPYRYSGGVHSRIGLTESGGHARAVDARGAPVLVVDLSMLPHEATHEAQALRILEVLAHGFHSYVARECVRGRFFFDGESESRHVAPQ